MARIVGDRISLQDVLLHGPLDRTVWSLVWPTIFGAISHAMFLATDAYFVAALGTAQLAALGAASAVDGMYGAIGMAMGTAVSALTAGHLGARNHAAAQTFIGHALLCGLGMASLWCVSGLLLLPVLTKLLSVPPESVPHFVVYMQIRLPGFLAALWMANANAAIRATGDTRTPVVIVIAVGLLNAVTTPLLAYGAGPIPAFGVAGAASATVLAVCVGALATTWVLATRDDGLVRLTTVGLRATWAPIRATATPVFLGVVIYMGLRAVVMALGGTMGAQTAAGVAAGIQLEFFGLAMTGAAAAVVPMFMRFNLGAGNHQRAGDTVPAAIRVALACQLVVFGALALLAPQLAGLFSNDARVQHVIKFFLWLIPFSHVGATTSTVATHGLISFGRMKTYLWFSAGIGLVSLPVYVGCAMLFGLQGLVLSLIVCRSAGGVAGLIIYRRVLKELNLKRSSLWKSSSNLQPVASRS